MKRVLSITFLLVLLIGASNLCHAAFPVNGPKQETLVNANEISLDGSVSEKITLKEEIKNSFTSKKVATAQTDYEKSFHLGWFALGFFLGIIGFAIALLINDEKRKGRIKWTAIGWGAWVALWLIILIA